MSTVGKVLIGLLILPVAGWVYLAAKVAEWNRAWGKQQQQVAKNIETTREQSVQTAAAIDQLKKQIDLVLRQKDDAVTGLRSLLSTLLRNEGSLKETVDRYTLQLASVQQAVDAARRRVETNTQDLAQTNRDLADARTELERLKQENAQTREYLATLRQNFQQLLAENRQLVERATAAATASPTSTSRPGRVAR
ncbi:MAG: hypothetical protein KatS3mg108_0403 [Isosphaeraceae bacterium]|jgi:chromosome segregation ATPase|nr:MAG: hypothetical protein KatS3mg108_0403 [Isosphaeraceae bacterium]